MDPKVKRALQQLCATTGLSLSVDESDMPDDLVLRIQQLERAYKENYSEEYYLFNLLKNEGNEWKGNKKIPLSRTNISGYVMVLQCDPKQEDVILDLLRAIYPERKKSFFIKMEKGLIAFVRFQEKSEKDQLLTEFHCLREQIQSELLCDCFIGIGKYFEDKENCHDSYHQACYAIRVGKCFSKMEQVYSFEKLGLYRLVDDLSKESTQDFMEELFWKDSIPDLDEELKQIAVSFFEHDLNVSETARHLYMHRNTLLHKLDRIESESGLDVRTFHGAVNLLLLMLMNQKER